MADTRTVLDVANDDCKAMVHLLCPCLDVANALDRLGIDPDMPFEIFHRRRELGERVEQCTTFGCSLSQDGVA